MKKIAIVFIVALLTVLTSCNTESNKERIILTNISGELNDVLVVIQQSTWDSESGKSLKRILQSEYYALPQYEPSFKAIQIDRSGFTNMFQLYRNIIDVNISDKIKTSKIWFGNDVYARPQSYLKIDAKNGIEFIALVEKNAEKIKLFFKNAEIARLQNTYKNRFNENILKHIKNKFNVRVEIPANYKLETDTNNFSWISFETPQISQGIFIYEYNYTDTSQFSVENLINLRNEFLKEYVPGSRKNSFMTTEPEFPVRKTTHVDTTGFYSVFLEGLWKVQGDFMGGPFISYSFPNKDKTSIICIDAYVYGPKKDKRNLIMQLEAIIKTVRY